jgi:HK97 family phage major capsid protein
MADEKTVDQLVDEVKTLVETKHGEVKAIAEDALGKTAAGEQLTAKAKELADEALTGLNEAKARLDELEQKLARKGGEGREQPKSLGEQITEGNEEAIAALGGKKGRVSVETKAIISALTTVAAGSAGDLIVPDRGNLVAGVERRMTVRDLLTPGRTNSNAIQYPKETGFTNAAATQTETAGSAKPQSDIQFDIATSSVTTIAHWVLATRQILDDVPMLQSYIDGRLRYGLAYAEELQLLNGDGTGTNLNGVYTQATAFASPLAAADTTLDTKVDVIRLAMLQAALAEFPPSGIVTHPVDWATIELTKTTDGAYLFANPQNDSQPRLWGLPVVATQAITSGNFLVGAYRLGAQIFDRQDARVEVSTEDSDNFRKNLVTILAEERLALAVYRPEAFIKGGYAAAITDITT